MDLFQENHCCFLLDAEKTDKILPSLDEKVLLKYENRVIEGF